MRCLSMLEYLLAAQADHLKLSTRAQGERKKKPWKSSLISIHPPWHEHTHAHTSVSHAQCTHTNTNNYTIKCVKN